MRRAGVALVIAVLAWVGCGQQPRATRSSSQASQGAVNPPNLKAHPQAIEPVAGSANAPGAANQQSTANPPASAQVSVGGSGGQLAQPVSDADIRRELAASGLSANANQATLTRDGLALAPVNAPLAVQQVITAGNEIAHLPYRFGGGHGQFEDTAYDCSGSLSFVFAAAGLLGTAVTSGELMNWGDAGPGRWITVFAAPGHTFTYVAGLRFDTVALAQTGSRWSTRPAAEGGSFVERHPPGL